MQHVLIIGKVWPEPGSSAAGSRTMELIELFGEQNWKISFASAAGESDYVPDLEQLNIEKYKVEINSSTFDELVTRLQPTLVVFDRFTTEEQFGWRVAQHCPGALRVLDTIDLHCLRTARHSALKQNRALNNNDLLLSDTAKREIAAIYRCDVSLMVSEYEIELLQHTFGVPAGLLHYTPFLFDAIGEAESAQWPTYAEREHFISIGNFLHEPNWDAVTYLKNEIWPIIRKQLPKVQLHIYGAYPSQKVFELHREKEGFLIKGRAENAFEVMRKARVCLAPIRFGAGIKGKLSDAMRCGTPSVTTHIGAEAMHGQLPWNGLIADSPQDFAHAAISLYTTKTLWHQSRQHGIAIINQFFSKQVHAKKLLQKISDTRQNLQQHRLNNFTGAMLQQQANAATKYMALWIEQKNKSS